MAWLVPIRDITEEDRRHYERDGVVHLPGLLDDDWQQLHQSGPPRGLPTLPRRRRSLREREETALEVGKSATLANGDLMDSPEFPLVWVRGEGYLLPKGTAPVL